MGSGERVIASQWETERPGENKAKQTDNRLVRKQHENMFQNVKGEDERWCMLKNPASELERQERGNNLFKKHGGANRMLQGFGRSQHRLPSSAIHWVP
jgi:hypothetical protein